TTFDVDIDDLGMIRRTMLALSGKAAARLRQAGEVGRTISIKGRLSGFRTLNRSRTLSGPTDVTQEIFEAALALSEAFAPGRPDPPRRRTHRGADRGRSGTTAADLRRAGAGLGGGGAGGRRGSGTLRCGGGAPGQPPRVGRPAEPGRVVRRPRAVGPSRR